MNTALHGFIESSAPAFASQRFDRFSEFDLQPFIVSRHHEPCGKVDLTRVVGTEHCSYQGASWLELLGNPPDQLGRLKRLRINLQQLQLDPYYYLRPDEKHHWSFYLVDGKYYVACGMHRTVIGRLFLACNGLPQVITGVGVTELVLDKPVQQRRKRETQGVVERISAFFGKTELPQQASHNDAWTGEVKCHASGP